MDLQRQSIETTGQVLLFSFREREATLILNNLFSPEPVGALIQSQVFLLTHLTASHSL